MKTYKYTIDGITYEVTIKAVDAESAEVEVNGTPYTVGLESQPAGKPASAPAPRPVVQPRAAAAPAPAAAPKPSASGAGAVTSPLPGVVLRVMVKPGDKVEEGQTLICLEAMKMENNIDAPHAGTIASVEVAQGASVMEGDVLLTIGE